MKNLVYIIVLVFSSTIMAQEKPSEVKEEVEVKTIKYKDSDSTTESKVKVITRETSNVKLEGADAEKINQNRVSTTKKVEKMIMVDDDADPAYDFLTKETFYISEDKNYKFTPNKKGFDIAFNNNTNQFVKTGNAWESSTNGHYIVSGENKNGIGYFDSEGNFIVEYYDYNLKDIMKIKYNKAVSSLK
ncbi:hypothetical protein AAFN75_15540 [Algibacter sp. AS12]|uniref:hypothetical protein n=1 Tax=Algibacter sp. AS12 TaxID=3135773 RepID=UPI00398A9AF7